MGLESEDNKAWVIVNTFIDLSFALDMVLTFMTSYTNAVTGKVVDDHRLIAKSYLLSWFLIDLVSVFPVEPIIKAA